MIFSLFKTVFFYFFYFVLLYKMLDSEHSMDIYISVKIDSGTIMKNPDMLKFVSDHLRTKKMCKYAVKKLPFLVRYVPDQYKA